MPGEAIASTTRVPKTFSDFIGPLIIVGALAFIVHLARPGSGTMFDHDHFGGTMVGLGAAVIAVVIGGYMTRSSLRASALRGPCPSCGVVENRRFENPADPTSLPTACGVCIAYLRASGNDMREEALDRERRGLPYVLSADQYLPAAKRTNRNGFKFEMPAMCGVCGDPNAPYHREISDGDHFGKGIGPLWSQSTHVLPQAGMGPSAATEDDKHSRGLSGLKIPVCAKHTEDEDMMNDVLKYSSGTLDFASYRYYKAFCELNQITRASTKRRG
jgi:hypothetical protein